MSPSPTLKRMTLQQCQFSIYQFSLKIDNFFVMPLVWGPLLPLFMLFLKADWVSLLNFIILFILLSQPDDEGQLFFTQNMVSPPCKAITYSNHESCSQLIQLRLNSIHKILFISQFVLPLFGQFPIGFMNYLQFLLVSWQAMCKLIITLPLAPKYNGIVRYTMNRNCNVDIDNFLVILVS